jgi:hypothetical protein
MNFRTKPRIKQAIQQAAALSGVDDPVFTMNAAYRSAMETIAAHERTTLQPVDHSRFLRRSTRRRHPPSDFGQHSRGIVRRSSAGDGDRGRKALHHRTARSCQARSSGLFLWHHAGRQLLPPDREQARQGG